MAKLIYAALMSLDGYVADANGSFDWAEPDEEVHTLVNDLSRPIGTYLLGRGMYEVLVAWDTMDTTGEPSPIEDYADIWRATDKIVYSRSLDAVSGSRTRLERSFDPDVVREMKASAERDLSVGGPDLGAQAFRAGLVDEIQLFLSPVVVGGGTRALADGVRVDLELMDERRFGNGTVFVRYRNRT
ncbi:MAG: dihydrofolate reductase family protein [Actinomycetota bacterium]